MIAPTGIFCRMFAGVHGCIRDVCRLVLSVIAIVVAVEAGAVVVDCGSVGRLRSLVTDTCVRRLTVSGVIDVRDLDFISSSLTELETLDMSGVSIAGYACSDGESYFDCTGPFASNELPQFCFFGKRYDSVILPDDLESIGEGALAGTGSLTVIELPATVTRIGDYAVNGSGITSLVIPNTVIEIGKGAFSSCGALQEVEISASVVGDEAFARCGSLRKVVFGNNVKTIGTGAFAGCHNLAEAIVGAESGLEVIGDRAFIDTSLAGRPFDSCHLLSHVGKWAFANTLVEHAFLPQGMSEMPEGVYFNATQVRDVSITSSAEVIGDYALYNCNSVLSVSIPGSVKEIGDYAFAGMCGLKSVYSYPVKVPETGENVFAAIDQPLVDLVVDAGAADAYRTANQWKEFRIEILSGTDETVASGATVKAWFSGALLNVRSDIDMLRLTLVDASGVVVSDKFTQSRDVSIDTGLWSGNFYVLSIVLANNANEIIKLIR